MTRKPPAQVLETIRTAAPGELVTLTIKVGYWKDAATYTRRGFWLGAARVASGGSPDTVNIAIEQTTGERVFVVAAYLITAIARHEGNHPFRLDTLEAAYHLDTRARVGQLHALALEERLAAAALEAGR